jgi:CRISPR-associated protein Csd1
MSWLKDLYDTYEAQTDAVGKYDDKGANPLLPVCHILTKTCICVTLDTNGNFISSRAEALFDTISPCSEKSIARSGSQPPPHALSDSLDYLDTNSYKHIDLPKCLNEKPCDLENDSKTCKNCISNSNVKARSHHYLEQLRSWANSNHSHSSIKSVYKYLSSESIINDLEKDKTLFLDESRNILTKYHSKAEQPSIFTVLKRMKITKPSKIAVRWQILNNGNLQDLWTDRNLHQSWIDFTYSITKKRGFCMITGSTTAILSSQSPKYIREAGDGSVLLSANDEINFTYKGKFQKGKTEQVATLGLETNQKAHAALKWLLKKQGYYSGETFALVAWGLGHTKIPQPIDRDDLFDDFEETIIAETKEGIGRNIASRIRGYSAKVQTDESIIVLAIDAPLKGQGRSSIVHYSKHQRSHYFNKLESWHTNAAWSHYSPYSKSYFWGAPSLKHIAEACYQRKVNGKWETEPKILSRTIKELLPCIIESKPIPKQIIKTLIERTSQRGSYKKSDNLKDNDHWQWEKMLAVTCSLYNHQATKKYTMALNTEDTSRDYLYGRLLAIADRLEEVALYKQATHLLEDADEKKKAGKSTRQTNAARLMYAFSKKPYTTWQNIHDKLTPYIERLSKTGSDNFYLSQIQDVVSLFSKDDFTKNTPLSGEYLLAFYSQRKQLQPTTKK